jgi:hypothetical protein
VGHSKKGAKVIASRDWNFLSMTLKVHPMVIRVYLHCLTCQKFCIAKMSCTKACHLYVIKWRTRQHFLFYFLVFSPFQALKTPTYGTRLQTIDLAVHWWPPLNK